MGFWDEINRDIDAIFGWKSNANSGSSNSSFGTSLVGSDSFSPDSDRAPGIEIGEDPHLVSQSSIASIQSKRSSPYTTIDIDVGLSGGSRGSLGGNIFTPNQFSPTNDTMKKIQSLLGIPNLLQDFGTYGLTPGVSYDFQMTGNSLTCERLSAGLIRTQAEGGQNIQSALIPNDIYVQQRMGIALNGLFVQFESTANDVFYMRPGEVLTCTFSRIFVTTFSSSMRWRLMIGNNATVTPGTDERSLRQSLHLWDGMGIFDNPTLQPVPFYQSQAFSGAGGLLQSFANTDNGGQLSAQPGGNVVGSVANKGYKILWITSISVVGKMRSVVGNTTELYIYKAVGEATTPGMGPGSASFPPYYLTRFSTDASTTGTQQIRENIQLAAPIRVVLAGFDTFNPANGVQFTGESLITQMILADTQSQFFVNMSGYMLGQQIQNPYANNGSGGNNLSVIGSPNLIPNNPYPNDVILPI